MSYDLTLLPRSGGALAYAKVLAYFRHRPNYEIREKQAWYQNDDTGVYFSFEVASAPARIAFNINYNRPTFFPLEAAPELDAVVRQFELTVGDPQIDGMGRGEFSTEAFVRGWKSGNEGAIAIGREQGIDSRHLYPGDDLRRIWRWNFARSARQKELGEKLFVPKISFADEGGVARAFAVWTDAMPVVLPRVDIVILVDNRAGFALPFMKHSAQMSVARWEEVVRAFPARVRGAEVLLEFTASAARPRDVTEFFRARRPKASKETLRGIASDAVLDAELFGTTATEREPAPV